MLSLRWVLFQRSSRTRRLVRGCGYEEADGQYFQFKETPASMDEKNFVGLQALTPGSESPSRILPQNRRYTKEKKLMISARVLDAPYFPEHGLLSRSI